MQIRICFHTDPDPYLDSDPEGKKLTETPKKNLKTMELVHVYLKFYNKITIFTNFLAFFVFFPKIFPSWIKGIFVLYF